MHEFEDMAARVSFRDHGYVLDMENEQLLSCEDCKNSDI